MAYYGIAQSVICGGDGAWAGSFLGKKQNDYCGSQTSFPLPRRGFGPIDQVRVIDLSIGASEDG
jgi:hypothetical protein